MCQFIVSSNIFEDQCTLSAKSAWKKVSIKFSESKNSRRKQTLAEILVPAQISFLQTFICQQGTSRFEERILKVRKCSQGRPRKTLCKVISCLHKCINIA